MARSAFGNPLSTGIALTGVVDMTPYQQIHARKMARLDDRKKENKRKQKELGSILSKINVDQDKIWWRNHDEVRIKYAETIADITKMYNAGDYAGIYKAINDFDTAMSGYAQAKVDVDNWIKTAQKGESYYDQKLLDSMQDRNVDDATLATMLDETGFGGYNPETGIFSVADPVARQDLASLVQDAVTGAVKMPVLDDRGRQIRIGTRDDGTPIYEMRVPDKEQIYQNILRNINPHALPYMLEERGRTRDELRGANAQETIQNTQNILNEELDKLWPIYATELEKGSRPYQPSPDKDPEIPDPIQLEGDDIVLSVKSEQKSPAKKEEAISDTFSQLPESNGATDYSMSGFLNSAVQRKLYQLGFKSTTDPGLITNHLIIQGPNDKKITIPFDEDVYDKVEAFVRANALDIEETISSEILTLPRDEQNIIIQTKESTAKNKLNPFPIKDAIVVGAQGMDYMALDNDIDIIGSITEVYDNVEFDKLLIDDLEDADNSFKKSIDKLSNSERYYKIIPSRPIEGQRQEDVNFYQVMGKQTGKGTGYESSRTGTIEYILVRETPELKSMFENNYGYNADALNPFENEQ